MIFRLMMMALPLLKQKKFLICWGLVLWNWMPIFGGLDSEPLFIVLFFIISYIAAIVVLGVLTVVLALIQTAASHLRAKNLAEENPELAAIEKQRAVILTWRIAFIVAAIVSAIVVGIFIDARFVMAAPVIVLMFYMSFISKKNTALNKDFKNVIVLRALSKAFDNVQYKANTGFAKKELYDLNLIQGFDIMRGNDWLQARRNGKAFCHSDVHIERTYTVTNSKGEKETHYETTFQGRVLRFDQSRNYPVRLVVMTENFPNARTSSELFKKLIHSSAQSDVETELDAFNQQFDAYCADQVAARVILTPQMMEGMMQLKNYTEQQMAWVFTEKLMYLFISTPGVDNLELQVSGNHSIKDQASKVASHVAQLAGLIDNIYFKEVSHA